MVKISHCVKSVHIRSYSASYFLAFGLNTERYSVRMRENTDQNNSEYGHSSRSVSVLVKLLKIYISYPRSYLSLEHEYEIKIFRNCTNVLIFKFLFTLVVINLWCVERFGTICTI